MTSLASLCVELECAWLCLNAVTGATGFVGGAVARRLAGSEMTTLAEALAEGQGSSA